MAGILEGVEAEAANDAISKRALFHTCMKGSGSHGENEHQDEGDQNHMECEISERQVHRRVGW